VPAFSVDRAVKLPARHLTRCVTMLRVFAPLRRSVILEAVFLAEPRSQLAVRRRR